ncbi:MAG: sigma-54 dependent transcriptional regulator [Myxococcota bacterium]
MAGERILIIDDELSMREFLTILLSQDGYRVEAVDSAEEGLERLEARWPALVLTDMNLPGMNGIAFLEEAKSRAVRAGKNVQIVVVTAFGTTESAIEAMKLGAANYVLKPFNNDELRLVVRRALGQSALEAENTRLRKELQERYHFGNLVGSSPPMGKVYELIRRVMNTPISCMIIGESGTGKEMVARAIHFSGDRADKPFVPINCGAIPENLVESELFGHKKGSFTGAVRDKDGLFKAADGGTLFLDEINSLPLPAQVKLLRALNERRFTPVGSVHEVSVNVRVIAASNADMEEAVQSGAFREDLFYRLNVVQIKVPTLRDRAEDIPDLCHHFVQKFSEQYGRSVVGFAPDAMRLVQGWHFPGNVRELRNLVERAVALCPGSFIQPEDLPEAIRLTSPPDELLTKEEDIPDDGLDLDALLAAVEKKWLRKAVDKADGNRTQAAKLLKMTFRSFRYRLAKYGLDPS